MSTPEKPYRGRLAPTPSGYLHAGHGATFQLAAQRAKDALGTLVMRIEDIDVQRCKNEYTRAALDDLRQLGIIWQEGPDIGGPFGPYQQSLRRDIYLEMWRHLKENGFIYPSPHSRRDVEQATRAPHEDDSEAHFPTEWRPPKNAIHNHEKPDGINWRFRVPDGQKIHFTDGRCGECLYEAGKDFGDFIVWRRDNIPAYELAVVADDHAMRITEVVRGEDLLKSTARQLLLYKAMCWESPDWYHTPLLRDENGRRLAKRHAALSLRALREKDLHQPPAA